MGNTSSSWDSGNKKFCVSRIKMLALVLHSNDILMSLAGEMEFLAGAVV